MPIEGVGIRRRAHEDGTEVFKGNPGHAVIIDNEIVRGFDP
jgi:hypothetical protein